MAVCDHAPVTSHGEPVRLHVRPSVSDAGLLPYERAAFLGYRWAALDAPPDLAAVVRRLHRS